MSTVIMAVCYEPVPDGPVNPYIIATCDKQLSSGFTSIEDFGFSKIQKVHMFSRWLLGFAGEPYHYTEILSRLRVALARLEDESFKRAKDDEAVSFPSGKSVVEAFEAVYNDYRNSVVRKRFLEPLGLSDQSQLMDLASRDVDAAGDLLGEISNFDLGISLLLAGFSDFGGVRMVSNDDEGLKDRYFSSPAHVIGSGHEAAMMHLNRFYVRQVPLREAIGRVLEAKFLSEAAEGVGVATVAFVLRQDGNMHYVSQESIAIFRALWDERSRAIPNEMLDALQLSRPSI